MKAIKLMNPYDPPSSSIEKRRKSRWLFIASSLVVLVGLIVAGLWWMHAASDMDEGTTLERRYATYDPEVHLFGISLMSSTASILSYGVAPAMLALTVLLVYRGIRKRNP